MKSFFFLFLLAGGTSFAQPISELSYISHIDSVVSGGLAEMREYEAKSDSYQKLTGYYYNNDLVYISTVKNGELANSIHSGYYIRNNELISSSIHKCRTNEYEILDLELYTAANTDSLGKVDYSKLPVNCLTVTLFCQSDKMTREVEGMDVFPELEPISARKESDLITFRQLVSDLDRYSGL